jgi:subtilisin family serine protease
MANYIISIDNSLSDSGAQACITDAGGTVSSALAITNTYKVDCTAEQLAAMASVSASSLDDASIDVALQTYDTVHLDDLVNSNYEMAGSAGTTITPYSPIYRGLGVTCYLIDTGINIGHVEFASASISNLHSAFIEDDDIADFEDVAGHGTAIASVIVGANIGVSTQTSLKNVKLFNANSGSATVGAIINAFNAVATDHADSVDTVKVVCTPWTVTQNDLIDDIVRSMNSSNLVMVTAAGNDGVDISTKSPAGVREIITVGGYNNIWNVLPFNNTPGTATGLTNFGAPLDVFGWSDGATLADANNLNGYAAFTGTSVATGIAAGVAVQYIQKHVGTTSSGIKEAILAEGHMKGIDQLQFSGSDYDTAYHAMLTTWNVADASLSTSQSGRLGNVENGQTLTFDIGLDSSATAVEVLDFAPLPPFMAFDTSTGILTVTATGLSADITPGVFVFAVKGLINDELLVEEFSIGVYNTDASEVDGDTASSFYYDTDNAEYDEIVNYQVAPSPTQQKP